MEAAHTLRQEALDSHYAAHPERFPRGRPIAKRPPAQVSINPDDGITTTDENLVNDPSTSNHAYPAIATTTPEKLNPEKRA